MEDKTPSIELEKLDFWKIKHQAFELGMSVFWKIKPQAMSLKSWTFGR
ncbi:hypothetical protein KZO58_07585 [Prevotella histicola]|nr:hypothetical protein [Prevotella histicola]MBW4739381.1 hypothetical protein [Prevotella histicola]MBW4747593.1 hypothetical protein [Prevotella histicola]MBW4776260.1 hypothetical protein [Prevotella histicola]